MSERPYPLSALASRAATLDERAALRLELEGEARTLARELGHDLHPFAVRAGARWQSLTACRRCGRRVYVDGGLVDEPLRGEALEEACP